jgi:hypothetical protein
MTKITVVLGAVIGGVVVAATMVWTIGSGFGKAEASPSDPTVSMTEVTALLNELGPDARATYQQDGSVSFFGQANAATRAEVRRAAEMANAGPASVRCEGAGTIYCAPIPDHAVVAALQSGEIVYQRTVYRSITDDVTDSRAPIFGADELVCDDGGGSGELTCKRVDDVHPTIPANEIIFVTYKPYKATFEGKTPVMRALSEPSVALTRLR